ncbi:MAG: hypothetical protein AB7U73_22320 [Pirellulales bacterium]
MLRLVKRLLAPALVVAALVAVPWASAQARHPHCGPGGYVGPGGYGYRSGYRVGYPGYGPGFGGYGYRVARPYGYFPSQPGPFGRYPLYNQAPGVGFFTGPGGFSFGGFLPR